MYLFFSTILIVFFCSNSNSTTLKEDRRTISELMKALEIFKQDCGFFPSTEQGLHALVSPPKIGKQCPKWGYDPSSKDTLPYLKRVPKDKWGNEFVYKFSDRPVIIGLGKDGKEGGTGINLDISNNKL